MGPKITKDAPSRGVRSCIPESSSSALVPPQPHGELLGTPPTGPGSTGGRVYRPWGGEPAHELLAQTPGELATPALEAKLGRAATTLWRWLLDLRGHEAQWLAVSYQQASEALRLSWVQVRKAFTRLREVGLVLCRHERVRSERVPVDVPRGTPGWYSTLEVLVSGAWDGPDLWLPSDAAELVRARLPHGGSRVGAGRRRNNQEVHAPLEQATRIRGLGIQEVHPFIREERPLQNSISTTASPLAGVGRPEAGRVPVTNQTTTPAIDEPTRTRNRPMVLTPDMPEPQQVRHLVLAYNDAVAEVYGDDHEPMYPVGPRSKVYPALRKACAALVEHEIPPRSWAEWAIRRARRAQERDGDKVKPPYILGVFSQNYVQRSRGYFRKTSDESYGTAAKVQQVHLEQYYRLREARRRQAGNDSLLFFPPWYVEMRQREIADIPAAADPTHLFPRALPDRK